MKQYATAHVLRDMDSDQRILVLRPPSCLPNGWKSGEGPARVDKALKAYWCRMIVEGAPMAEATLERALKKAAVKNTLFV
jgi:hypothetical protein